MVVKNGSYCGSIIVVINGSLSTGGSEIYYKMCLYTWEIHGTILGVKDQNKNKNASKKISP